MDDVQRVIDEEGAVIIHADASDYVGSAIRRATVGVDQDGLLTRKVFGAPHLHREDTCAMVWELLKLGMPTRISAFPIC